MFRALQTLANPTHFAPFFGEKMWHDYRNLNTLKESPCSIPPLTPACTLQGNNGQGGLWVRSEVRAIGQELTCPGGAVDQPR